MSRRPTDGGPPAIDVARLPLTVFGHRSLTWWATIGFILLEGMSFFVTLFAYLFVLHHAPEWPPPGVPLPDLAAPTIGLILLLTGIPIAIWTDRMAHAESLEGTRAALAVSVAASVAILVVRAFEFRAVHVSWDSSVYGSVVWGVLALHTLLLLTDLLESAGFLAVFILGPVEEKHFVDADDLSFYWWFVIGIWIPAYVILYWVPRWM